MPGSGTDIMAQSIQSVGGLASILLLGIGSLAAFIGKNHLKEQAQSRADSRDEVENLRTSVKRMGEKLDDQDAFLKTQFLDVTRGYNESVTRVAVILDRVVNHLEKIERSTTETRDKGRVE
jgi:hypothetical protein